MNELKERGRLITLEGLDRSGKTTQSLLLADYLNNNGKKAKIIRFPGKNIVSLLKILKERSTNVGQAINSYLKGNFKVEDEVIHILFSANRWEFK